MAITKIISLTGFDSGKAFELATDKIIEAYTNEAGNGVVRYISNFTAENSIEVTITALAVSTAAGNLVELNKYTTFNTFSGTTEHFVNYEKITMIEPINSNNDSLVTLNGAGSAQEQWQVDETAAALKATINLL